MDYKHLFKRTALLISSPGKAWEEIEAEADKQNVMSEFVYPMIGLCGLSVFIGALFGNAEGTFAFQRAMTLCCAKFVSLFGGYFLAAYLTNLLGKKMLERDDERELNQQFIGYSMVVIFGLDIFSGLFSLSILRWILQFYTVFVVYEGARDLMKVEAKNLTHYSLLVTLLIIVCPTIISIVFEKMSLILN